VKWSVMIVEDDEALRESLAGTLTAMGLAAMKRASGDDCLEYLHRKDAGAEVDVVLLDLNMPGRGGIETCRLIREAFPMIGIIILTVRETETDKIAALDAGADDYITKPFQLGELFARMRAAFRRRNVMLGEQHTSIESGNLMLDPVKHRVTLGGDQIHLTPTEFKLLHLLMQHLGRPLSHHFLLTSVWGPDYGNEREYLRTYINQLRRKIEVEPAKPRMLLTENYIGYRFEGVDVATL
jgi:two-component system, OmpR family, KDP operon response regulator KdpE